MGASLVRVDSAKHIAKGKGVHREVESEGSRRQTSGLTNRNHIYCKLATKNPHQLGLKTKLKSAEKRKEVMEGL